MFYCRNKAKSVEKNLQSQSEPEKSEAVVNTAVDDAPTPAASRPSRAKKYVFASQGKSTK
jgi:hypothetical protein